MNRTDPTIPAAAIAALERGHKIEAIKLTRETTGLGLRESKEAIEAYLAANPVLNERYKAKTSHGAGFLQLCLIVIAVVLAYLILSGKI